MIDGGEKARLMVCNKCGYAGVCLPSDFTRSHRCAYLAVPATSEPLPMSAEFSDDLISHCEQKALEAVAADTADLVRAVLLASGYAELVEALTEAEDILSTLSLSSIRRALIVIRAALAAAGQPQGSGV